MKIKSMCIENFRSIKRQKINNISNALVLVGKNNGGKSSIINAIRTFFGEYQVIQDDFHKNAPEMEIIITFQVDESYLKNFVFDSKIGISKIPSNSSDFSAVNSNTMFEKFNFTSKFKSYREEILKDEKDISILLKEHEDLVNLWIKAISNKFNISNNELTVCCSINNKKDFKPKYTDIDGKEIKDVTALFPKLAFIDDDRNFDEEEVGKNKTLTNDIFGNHILKKSRTEKEISCDNCIKDNCKECLDKIHEKNMDDLNINDLEKLIKNKLDNASVEISSEISSYFQSNYKDGYKIYIEPKSNVDKSLSINTKIYNPTLDQKIELSNVGAGLRSIYILSLLQAYHKLNDDNTTIFLIEEPEIYLHPSLQKDMGTILLEISQSNQVIFTTHSPLLLKNFEIDDIKNVYINDECETIISNTSIDEVLRELGYSTEDILQTNFVIFVEGKDDKARLKDIINNYYSVDTNDIFFVDTNGCKNIETYATLKFLNKTNMKDDFLIIRDSDTKEKEDIKNKTIQECKKQLNDECPDNIEEKILVLDYSAFDNYFLEPEILIKMGIIKDIDQYSEKINKHINTNKTRIIEYIKNNNSESRASELIDLIYRDCEVLEKIEDIKKYVRAHELFGEFGGKLKYGTSEYVEFSNEDNFSEIIDFLDTADYFKYKKKNLSLEVSAK
ncbi:MAG: AAA-15 domain-containing protein [Sporanaerobacter sp.]|uniref:ATP-dependent nuclease n=1 Tax=Sporanaerobacter sp. TaxID=2010183 RepID=UPI003A0FC9FB